MEIRHCSPLGATLLSQTYELLEDAVNEAANQAVRAYCQGTFSVGGVMLDKSGNVLNALHNNVVEDGMTFDPTAHGERQLIDWYYDQISSGALLPPPEEITIVTSLDPCCMCSGSILSSGFNVVSAAFDTFSGIDYDTLAHFPSLDPALRPVAQATFSYPEVSGDSCFARPATSAPLPAFFSQTVINQNTQALCLSLFEATLSGVQDTVNNDLPPDLLIDPATLAPDDPLVIALRDIYPQALTYKAPSLGTPDAGLAPYLLEAAAIDAERGGKGSSVAFLDYFGNLMLCLPGNQVHSPVQTPFMLTTRSWAQLRHQLYQQEGDRVLQYFGHPKYGTFVLTLGQDTAASSLIDLGAYGSTMEEALPAENPWSLQYVVPSIPQSALTAYCQTLPPLYSQSIGVMPRQVSDRALIDAVTEGLPLTARRGAESLAL